MHRIIQTSTLSLVAWAAVTGCRAAPARAASQKPQTNVALSHALPRMNGEQLRTTLIEVSYQPGGSSRPHRHPCPVAAYVVDGAVRIRIDDEPEMVYRAGQSFFEAANSAHLVSANASDTKPAKLLAIFICDKDTALSVPLSDSSKAVGK
jgi:quercetin dioxygenase-like cupin family protein